MCPMKAGKNLALLSGVILYLPPVSCEQGLKDEGGNG